MSGRYEQPIPWNWFFKRRGYVMFMLRELTAVLICAYLIFLLVMLARMGSGEAAFAQLVEGLRHPVSRLLHGLAFIAAIWHSVTWFNLTPRAMPIFFGEHRVADPLVAFGMGYFWWICFTAVIIWGAS